MGDRREAGRRQEGGRREAGREAGRKVWQSKSLWWVILTLPAATWACFQNWFFFFFFLFLKGWFLHFHSWLWISQATEVGSRSFLQSQAGTPVCRVQREVAVAALMARGPRAAGSEHRVSCCSGGLSWCPQWVRRGAASLSYCPSRKSPSSLGASCRLPRKSSSQAWPSTSSRRLAVDAAAPSE